MYVSELALKGIRGFSRRARLAFTPGYQSLVPPGPEHLPLIELFSALLFPDALGSDVALREEGEAEAKVALTLLDARGREYRLTRDIGQKGTLQRWNQEKQEAEFLGGNAQDISQFLRSQVGVPTRATFDRLYCFRSRHLPSRRPVEAVAMEKPPEPTRTRSLLAPPSLEDASLRARLEGLERELEASSKVEALLGELDGVESKWEESRRLLRDVEALKQAAVQAQKAVDEAPTPGSLGLEENALERAGKWEERKLDFQGQLQRLESEKRALESEKPRGPSLLSDGALWAALLGGLVWLFGFALLPEGFRPWAFLDVLPFSFAALRAVQHVERRELVARLQKKTELLGRKRSEVEKAQAREMAFVEAALKKAGVETVAELGEVLSRKAACREVLQEAVSKHQQKLAEPAVKQALEEGPGLFARMEAFRAELARLSQRPVRPSSEVSHEILQLNKARASVPSQREARSAPIQKTSTGLWVDPTPELLGLAADELQVPVETLFERIRPGVEGYLRALGKTQWTAVEFDKRGHALVVERDVARPLATLEAQEANELAWTIHMATLECCLRQNPRMVLVDERYALMESVHRGLVEASMQRLGKLTQVLLVSRAPLTGAGGSLQA